MIRVTHIYVYENACETGSQLTSNFTYDFKYNHKNDQPLSNIVIGLFVWWRRRATVLVVKIMSVFIVGCVTLRYGYV